MLLLFHVLAHIYHSHFEEIEILNLHPQTNCIFAYFILFNEQFTLVEEKEIEILSDLAIALKLFPPKPNDDHLNDPSTPSSSPKAGDELMPSTPTDAMDFNVEEEEVISTSYKYILTYNLNL